MFRLVLRSWGRVDLGRVDLGAEFVMGPSCLGAELSLGPSRLGADLTGAELVWCRVNRLAVTREELCHDMKDGALGGGGSHVTVDRL